MPLETASFINDLVSTNPVGSSDPKSEGDDHIKNIKAAVKATLPGMAGRFRRIQAKSSAYTAVLTDNTSILRTSGTWTLALDPAATLGNGWEVIVYNDGVGTITVDPSGTETINGVATLVIGPGRTARIFGEGTSFLAELFGTNIIPTGTLMLFQQTTAPTGWTKQTTHNDKALRVVSGAAGSGGAAAFSSVFGASKSTAGYTLAVADIPSHNHGGATGSDGAHTHNITGASTGAGAGVLVQGDRSAGTQTDTNAPALSAGAHTHTISAQGGGGSHAHGLSLDLQFVDLIIASKD